MIPPDSFYLLLEEDAIDKKYLHRKFRNKTIAYLALESIAKKLVSVK